MATTGDYSPLSARRPPQLDFEEDLLEVSPPGASPKPSSKPSSFSAGRRPAETPGSVKVSLSRASSRVSKVQQTPVAETDPVDRTTFNQIFSQLTETGELAVERLAEGLEMLEGVGCDKEWIHEILRDQFNGRSFLDRSDFYDFVNMYRNQRFTFMRKIFSEVDQDHSQSVSLQEVVQLLGRRGITPVLSCVERIFREVTGESGLRDLTFEEFVKIYDVVQARAGFSEYDLVRLKKVWSRYDRDGNQLLSADELRVALKWQGFAVDAGVVDSLAQEVADGKGLNQREFLIFMRKYRDQEVQKIMQMGVATKPEFKGRRDHIKVTRETRVQMKDLPMLLSEIGYEEVASEVMQECASLVHLVDLDAARGLPAISHTFSPDCIYEFMEQLRAAHGFTHSERVDMLESFHRFQGEKESCSSFDHDCDTARSGSTISESEAFDLHITVMQLFCALRWLGYPAELWQVQELLDSMELTGAELREEEFIRIMAVVRDREMEGIVKVLKQAEAEPPPPSPLFSPKSPTKKGDPSRRWGMLRKKPAVSNSEFQTRLHRIFHALGYEASPAMLADLEGDFTQGQFSKDRWGVLRALRQHRRRIRNTIRQNFGFLDHELEPLREIFFGFAERLTGKVRGAKQIGKLLKELFEGSETDKDQRQRAQEAIAQATHTTKAENLDFEEFLHLMRICLGQMASALLQQEEVSIQKMSFQQEEIMGFRSIFNRLAVDSRARQPHHVTVHTAVLLVPSASYLAVENELATVAGAYSREARESLQEVLQKMDAAGKGGLYFWEFLEAATALLESNWQNINEEAKKVIVDAWAEKEAEALYSSKPAVMVRTSDLNQTVRPSAQA